MKAQLKADFSLIMVTLFWGGSCLLVKIGLNDIQGLNLIALRFVFAFALAGTIFYKKIINANFEVIKYSALLGTLLFFVFIFMTFGVKYTTVSNAGFLTCLTAILVPIINFFLFKEKVKPKGILSIIMAFLGVYLLTMTGNLQFNLGDLLCISCSFLYSFHIIFTGKITRLVDSITLGVLQLGFVALYSSVFSLFFENLTLPKTRSSWIIVLVLSLFCTGIAFVVQTVAQKYTSSNHTGLIFALEPVFAAISAYIFLQERLSTRGYVGAIILLLSILIMELEFKLPKNKYLNKSENEI